MGALGIPDDLVKQASRVPGLSERITQFIKLEIAQYEQRQKRFHPDTLALMARARQNAEQQRAAGFDREEVKQDFVRHLQALNIDEEGSEC